MTDTFCSVTRNVTFVTCFLFAKVQPYTWHYLEYFPDEIGFLITKLGRNINAFRWRRLSLIIWGKINSVNNISSQSLPRVQWHERLTGTQNSIMKQTGTWSPHRSKYWKQYNKRIDFYTYMYYHLTKKKRHNWAYMCVLLLWKGQIKKCNISFGLYEICWGNSYLLWK